MIHSGLEIVVNLCQKLFECMGFIMAIQSLIAVYLCILLVNANREKPHICLSPIQHLESHL
jgi:hypothetical protein